MNIIHNILLGSVCFLGGVMYTDYHYRDIPKEVIVSVPSRQEMDLNNKLQICKGQIKSLMVVDGNLVLHAMNLVDDYTARLRLRHIDADPDRYQDMQNDLKKRGPIIKALDEI